MIDQLSSLIGARRRELGLSQQQLGEAAGLSRTTLSHLEHGKAPHGRAWRMGRRHVPEHALVLGMERKDIELLLG